MDLEKFQKMARLVLEDLSGYGNAEELVYCHSVMAKFLNLMAIGPKVLPDHKFFFTTVFKRYRFYRIHDVRSVIFDILAILEIEKSSEAKIKGLKIFESAEEKLKQANLSFRKDDYASAFHNLNTALELVLKDKLGIPTTITGINTSNLIDIWVKYKLKAHLYLTEARKRVLMIDNKIKHQGYSPSKIDCINGIKAMEELISRLRSKEITLTEEIRNKIYEGL
jgi:HEPN domain-containing protein